MEDSGKFKVFVVFECRGLEPIDFEARVSTAACNIIICYLMCFYFQSGFCASSTESSCNFEDIDLSEKVW